MGTSYTIDSQQRCIFSTLSGTVSEWDLVALAQRLWQDPWFDPGFARVVDCANVTETTVSPDLCRAIASDFRAHTEGRVAVVASSDIDLMRRLAHIYSQHLQPADVAAFFNRQEALRWLGVHEMDEHGEHDSQPMIPAEAPA